MYCFMHRAAACDALLQHPHAGAASYGEAVQSRVGTSGMAAADASVAVLCFGEWRPTRPALLLQCSKDCSTQTLFLSTQPLGSCQPAWRGRKLAAPLTFWSPRELNPGLPTHQTPTACPTTTHCSPATCHAGLVAAALAVVADALAGCPGAMTAGWLDRPTALAAVCLVVLAPLVCSRGGPDGGRDSASAAAAYGAVAAALWAAGLVALAAVSAVKGELARPRLWPQVSTCRARKGLVCLTRPSSCFCAELCSGHISHWDFDSSTMGVYERHLLAAWMHVHSALHNAICCLELTMLCSLSSLSCSEMPAALLGWCCRAGRTRWVHCLCCSW